MPYPDDSYSLDHSCMCPFIRTIQNRETDRKQMSVVLLGLGKVVLLNLPNTASL